MEPEIRSSPVEYDIIGVSCTHDPSKPFSQEILALLDKLWPLLKAHNVKHDGLNRVVYDRNHLVLAGVAPDPAFLNTPGLQRYTVRLGRHAYWKHVGPYRLIPSTGEAMRRRLESTGEKFSVPMVEVYGHWTPDESKLVTETFVALG